MIVLLECLGHSWMIENPAGSCILLHPWLQWAIKTIQGASGKVLSFEIMNAFDSHPKESPKQQSLMKATGEKENDIVFFLVLKGM